MLHKVWKFIRSIIEFFTPSYVVSVHHVCSEKCKITELYNSINTCRCWSNGINTTLFFPNKGHFMFKVWNRSTRKYECILLSHIHLRHALSLVNVSGIWAFSDIGIVMSITDYLLMKPEFYFFAIMVDGKDVTDKLDYIKTSLLLPRNLTPTVVKLVLGADPAADFIVLDHELNESRMGNDSYIVAS